MKQPRTVDPYTNLDVIDANAPRFNQAVIGTLALVAFLTGWWPLLAILAAQLVIGLTLGRRWCLPCFAYFELVQPRIGEGPVEDSRPPRFANKVGIAFLESAPAARSTRCSRASAASSFALRAWAGRLSLRRNDGQGGRDSPLPAALVDDVDAVVLPVGPRDPEEDREPADRSQPSLLRERLVEAKLAAAELVVAPGLLAHAVHEDLERFLHSRRKGHDPGFIHCG